MLGRRLKQSKGSSVAPGQMSVREAILETADSLFYREGIRAVGVDRLSEKAGVAKASLYHHFSGKEDIVLAYLEARHNKILGSLIDAGPSEVSHMFNLLEQKAANPEFRGCAFLLAVSEYPNAPAIVALAQRHKRAIREHFLSFLSKSMLEREECATQIAMVYDGALAGLTIHRDPALIPIAKQAALRLLDNYLSSQDS